jgi:hypothetical protein
MTPQHHSDQTAEPQISDRRSTPTIGARAPEAGLSLRLFTEYTIITIRGEVDIVSVPSFWGRLHITAREAGARCTPRDGDQRRDRDPCRAASVDGQAAAGHQAAAGFHRAPPVRSSVAAPLSTHSGARSAAA